MNYTSYHMGPQILPKSKKNEAWKKNKLDKMAEIAERQVNRNGNLLKNYQMIRGVFIPEFYVTDDGYKDMIASLTTEFELPSYLRHFDIIASTVNTMSGEWQEHPDNYMIRRVDEFGTNEFLRKKKMMIDQFITEQLQIEINTNLIKKGLDPTGESIPEEERELYIEELNKQRQAMTPPEVEKYMRNSYRDFAEIWATNKMERANDRFNYKLMERTEIEDIFTASKCARHYFVRPTGHKEETWNPVYMFYLISPDEYRLEKSEVIGRKFKATYSDVISRYGHRMTKKEIESLDDNSDITGGHILDGKVNAYGIDYNAIIPFLDYPEYKLQQETLGFSPGIAPSDEVYNAIMGNTSDSSSILNGLFDVVEGYFRNKERYGLLKYENPETGLVENVFVSEDFIVPNFIKVVNNAPNAKRDVNTICWSYQDIIYEGVRISGKNLKEPIYLGGEPLEYQPHEPDNKFDLLMPVVGLLYNHRNSNGSSVVDLMTSDQIGHNVVMNQGMQLLQRELGRFLIMDPRMIPNMKDWGGERGWEKFTEVAKTLGISFADTSPEKLKGANGGNNFPRMIDMDETQRIMGRFKLAEMFEMAAKRRIGMSDQRLGDIGSSETAEGVKQSINKSYNQTRSYFTDFSDYIKRTKRMSLQFYQYCDSKKDTIRLNMGISEEERSFIDVAGNELSYADLDLIISDNQEDLRKMQLMKNLFMTNPNVATDPLDLYAVINANAPVQMRQQFEKSKADRDAAAQREQQLKQQELEQFTQINQEKTLWEKEKHYTTLESNEKKAYIQSFGRQLDNMNDSNGDSISDILQYEKLNVDSAHKQQLLDIAKSKAELDKQKQADDMVKHKDDIDVKRKKLKLDELKERIKVKVARINPG